MHVIFLYSFFVFGAGVYDMKPEEIRVYAAKKMEPVLRSQSRGRLSPATIDLNVVFLYGQCSNLRHHASGVDSLQLGNLVGYVFDLSIDGVTERYQQMVDHAQQGILTGTDLLIGKLETHALSGIDGTLAYLVTTAQPSSLMRA